MQHSKNWMFAILAVPRVPLSANRSKLGLRLCQAKTAGLKAGSLQGHKNGVLGVTRQSVGTVPTKVGMFWPAFRLINCVDLSGRCLPCRNGMVTHNALQDVSDNNGRCTCCMQLTINATVSHNLEQLKSRLKHWGKGWCLALLCLKTFVCIKIIDKIKAK